MPSSKSKPDSVQSENELLRVELDAAHRMIKALRFKIEAITIENDTLNSNNVTSDRNAVTSSSNADLLKRIEGAVQAANGGDFYYDRVPKRLILEMAAILEKGAVTVSDAAVLVNMSTLTVKRDLAILKKLEWIVFKGSRNNGAYHLTDKTRALFENKA
jgi:hypothetical protein